MPTTEQNRPAHATRRAAIFERFRLSDSLVGGLLVLFDQGIVSIANFLTTWIVSQSVQNPKEELGIYGLGFTVAILVAGIPKALVWTPYTTNCPRLAQRELPSYSGSVTIHMTAISLLTSIALGLTALSFAVWSTDSSMTRLFTCLAPSMIVMLMREHVRRLCLSWMRLYEVLALDTLVSFAQVLGLWWVFQAGRLTGANAYLIVAAASLPSIAWLLARRRQFHFDRGSIVGHARRNWDFSKWIFAGAVAVLISNGAYRWLLNLFHGTSAVGEVTSAQSVILIINPLLLGISNYLGPKSAAVYVEHGLVALERSVIRTSLALLAVLVLFSAALATMGGPFIERVFGRTYACQGSLVLVLALGLFSEVLLMPIEFGILTANQGNFLFTTAVLRLLVTLTIGTALVWQSGAYGIGWGMAAGNLLVLALEWIVFRKVVRNG